MKIILTLASALIIGIGSAAAQYCCTTEGKVFTFKNTDVEENVSATSVKTIESVQTAADGVVDVLIKTINYEPKGSGSITTTETCKYNPADGTTTFTIVTPETMVEQIIDMISEGARQNGVTLTDDDKAKIRSKIKVTGNLSLVLPAEAEPGTPFDKSTIRCRVETQTMTMSISKGFYQGKEKVETPAGTFDAFKIEYQFKQANGGQVDTQQVTSWYVEGIGEVRSVNTDKKGNIKDESILTEIK